MPRPDDGKRRFEVHISAAIAQRLRRIQRVASREGRGETVLTALRKLVLLLEQEPFDFGEPLYRLPALRLQVRHGAVSPLFIDFAVSEDRPLVFIKGIKLLGD